MNNEVSIRLAKPADARAIAGLWLAMMREHEDYEPHVTLSPGAEEAYHQYASHHIIQTDSIVYVAEQNREIVGYCLAFKTRNLPMFLPEFYGYLSDIALHPNLRGKGIGDTILQRVQDWFREQGCKNIQLQVYYRNEGGKNFWQKANFENFVNGLWFDL